MAPPSPKRPKKPSPKPAPRPKKPSPKPAPRPKKPSPRRATPPPTIGDPTTALIPHELEKLTPTLTFVNDLPVLRSAAGATLVAARDVTVLSRAETGSGTWVYRLRTRDGAHVVVKRALPPAAARSEREQARRRKILAGLQHEREVYRLTRELVDRHVTPFVMALVKVHTPLDAFVSTTDTGARLVSLSHYVRTRPLTRVAAGMLVAYLAYTLEVFHRIGMRHNDLHLGNVLMHRGAAGRTRLHYASRAGGSQTFDLPLLEWQPKIFDFDRVFKRTAPTVAAPFARALSTRPVLDRFGWHNPNIFKSDLNATKVVQHLSDYARRYGQPALRNVVAPFALRRTDEMRLVRDAGLDPGTWDRYYLAVRARDDREVNLTRYVGELSTEALFLSMCREFALPPDDAAVTLRLDMRALRRGAS